MLFFCIQRETQKKYLQSYKMLYEPTGQHRSLTMAHGDLNIPHLTAIADHKGMAVQPTAGTAIYSSQEQMSQNLPPPPSLGTVGVCSSGGIFSTSPSVLLHVFTYTKPLICA